MTTPFKKLTAIMLIALLALTTAFVGTGWDAFALDEEPAAEQQLTDEVTEEIADEVPEVQAMETQTLETTINAVASHSASYTGTVSDTVTVTPAWGRTVQLYRYDPYHGQWILEGTYQASNEETASVAITYPQVWKSYSQSDWKIVCPEFTTDDAVLSGAEQTVRIDSQIANAKAAIVLDGVTGEVLYAQNARDHLKIASLTKMVTMMVVCDKGKFNKKVKITAEAVKAKKQSGGLGFKKGDKVRMKDLVHAGLMNSANDAAAAAACGVSKTQSKFAVLMRKKAAAIGANETTFQYAYGDWYSDTYSTAYDQALIGREFMTNSKYSKLRTIVKKQKYQFRTLKKKKKYKIKMGGASTSLIKNGCSIGIKSGYNPPAGYCYANAWKHNGRLYISVVLGAPSLQSEVASQQALIQFGNYSADHGLTRITVK